MKTFREFAKSLQGLLAQVPDDDETQTGAAIALEAGKPIQVETARSGTFVDMHGTRVVFTPEVLANMAAGFDPAEDHKVKIGHKPIDTDTPDYGDVTALAYDEKRDRLLATIVPTEITVEKNRKEGFRRASLEARGKTAAGPWTFEHLALLGARRPGVDNLAPIALAAEAGEGVAVFLEALNPELGEPDPRPEVELHLRAFDAKARKAAAKSGAAMPDGSFPIENEQDLRNAIQAIGRAKDPEAAKAHIRSRAKVLGLTKLLPTSWSGAGPEEGALDKSATVSPNDDPKPKEGEPNMDEKALQAAQAEAERLRKIVAAGAGNAAKAFVDANAKRLPLRMRQQGIEAFLAALMASEAVAAEPVVLKFAIPEGEGKTKEVEEAPSAALMRILAALPEQTTAAETTETSADGHDRAALSRIDATVPVDADSAELDLAVEEEMKAAKARGENVTYFDAYLALHKRAARA